MNAWRPYRVRLKFAETIAGQARRCVADALTLLNLSHLADDAKLLASELATNAFLHGAAPVSLAVYEDCGLLFVEVSDGAGNGLTARNADADEETGRGLFIVQEIAADWGIEATGRGKRVWASLTVAADTTAPVEYEDPPTVAFERIAA